MRTEELSRETWNVVPADGDFTAATATASHGGRHRN
jgi:hypothetical protein